MKKRFYLSLVGLLALATLSACGSQGPQGEKGSDGANGLNGSDGKDGNDGKNGKDGVSIKSIELTSSKDNVDTYTVTYTDGNTWTFEVVNGTDGKDGKDGSQGIQGIQGEPGKDGNTPSVTIGDNGNWFIDGVDSGYSASGLKGDPGKDGKDGKDGTNGTDGKDGKDGTNGTNGKDGSQIYTGSGAPDDAQGNSGDLYLDTSSGNVYTKGDSWTISGNIKGQDGQDGKDGTNGTDGKDGEKGETGASLLTGSGVPDDASLGRDGDSYVDLSTFNYYTKVNGYWMLQGNIRGEDSSLKHTVRFYVDNTLIETIEASHGAKISAPDESLTAGYPIAYWYVKEGSLKSPWSFTGCTVTSDLYLYAAFSHDAYTITFVDNAFATSLTPMAVYYDEHYTLPTLENKQGYTFKGWNDENGNSFASVGVYRLTSNLTLTASWEANTYSVTLDPDGGNVSTTSMSVTYGSSYDLPTPTKDNYTFAGWYDKTSGEAVASSGTWLKDCNAVYVAKWNAMASTFFFSAGEGTCPISEMTITYGEPYELPTPYIDLGDGARLDKTFYWYLNGTRVEQSGDSWTYSSSGGTLNAVWGSPKTIRYGYYPQTHVSDSGTIASLDELTTPGSSGWYTLNGEYYAKKAAAPYGSNYTFDDGTPIKSGDSYWFKCEPIEWKILSYSGNEYSLVSSLLLDSMRYSSSSSSYENSEIRSWLNNEFVTKAFSLGKSYLDSSTSVDNSADTTDSSPNQYAGNSTTDTAYLLSYQDYANSSYFASASARQCKTTDWARASGACYDTSSSNLYNGYYWTRSPRSSSSGIVSDVSSSGELSYSSAEYSSDSVRPAIKITVA